MVACLATTSGRRDSAAQSQYLVEPRLRQAENFEEKKHSRDTEPLGCIEVFLLVGGVTVVVGNFKDVLGDHLLEQGQVRAMPGKQRSDRSRQGVSLRTRWGRGQTSGSNIR